MKLLIIMCILILNISCTKPIDEPIEPTIGTIMDIEGNVYHTETYGTQTWMVNDLITTHYNDGSLIKAEHIPGDYSFYVIEVNNICPIGYHVPKSWEWEVLANYCEDNETSLSQYGLGYWWSSSNIIEGYESPQARGWYLNDTAGSLAEFVELKERLLSIRCIKD